MFLFRGDELEETVGGRVLGSGAAEATVAVIDIFEVLNLALDCDRVVGVEVPGIL